MGPVPLAIVTAMHRPWPINVESDTDDYRQGRAIEVFNLAARCCDDLYELKPMEGVVSWVPHILLFIVPRQMVSLGDPARRSCDACESFGALFKKTIKHATCRRRLMTERADHDSRKPGRNARWRQSFTVGYIQQAFTRLTVSERLRCDTGANNQRFLQRADWARMNKGKSSGKRKGSGCGSPARSIAEALEAAIVAGELDTSRQGAAAAAGVRQAVRSHRENGD